MRVVHRAQCTMLYLQFFFFFCWKRAWQSTLRTSRLSDPVYNVVLISGMFTIVIAWNNTMVEILLLGMDGGCEFYSWSALNSNQWVCLASPFPQPHVFKDWSDLMNELRSSCMSLSMPLICHCFMWTPPKAHSSTLEKVSVIVSGTTIASANNKKCHLQGFLCIKPIG